MTRTGLGTSGSTAPRVSKLDFPRYCSNEDLTRKRGGSPCGMVQPFLRIFFLLLFI